ncbi:uncharacterized protein LOC107221879 isoform X1 [Neodiprion lecontei]|uniref:Uncharacterized protein LOC107221879 isoform X1 n=1 Tax=Neodiprion lecontei TaxID=441921 RepID=A0A6J0BPP1_NEOLC|nr:uncharacterized protein LOC107221879 isoform X1 [Neodiprion lecontei]XP_046423874.1 uncharacterized protein LOC124181389 isoform X1 [Neodiprion fabricii]
MDSHVGLDYIVENPDYCSKLASALNTANTSVKKQVVELLSALCVYSQDGRQRTIDTLHTYQELKRERYRFRVVVDELQNATGGDYRTALLAFINCLIISTPILKDRVRIRNEFIGLKLLPILNELRKESSRVPDLQVQLDVFDEQRESDEEQSLQGPSGIDLSSHLDIFYAILKQIADTPQEIPFLSILQHLLRIDPKEPASDLAWDTAETLVHRATLLENREDATKLLRSPSLQQTNLCCWGRGGDQTCNSSRKTSVPPLPPLPPPPPPLPIPGGPSVVMDVVPPPPLPPLLLAENSSGCNSGLHRPPPVPPPLQVPQVARSRTPEPPNYNAKLLPQQEIPTPKTKMKTINWNKIPNDKVIGKRNIWSLVANNHQNSPMTDLDWAEMEGLFCQQMPPMVAPATLSTTFAAYGVDTEKRRREPSEITLLDGKRSLNVNIFLKQFRSSNEDIIQLIREGGHDDIGAEKLRGLLKILPEVDELEMLKCFDGDRSKLGNAEKFFLQLIQVPNYKLRIECMLLKEEFAANMSYLEPSINSMILAGEDLMTNKPLQEVLYMVLVAGNFLNSGGYAGNAAGVKLSSLQKLTEIRANKPGMNLIHYVALQVEKKRKDLLCFTNDMKALEAATRTTVEQLSNEFNSLDTKIKNIKNQINIPSTDHDIQEQMAPFLKIAEREMAALKRDMEELEGVRRTLAEFFCEDINSFKLEECFRVFQQFCQRFKQAIAENERRRMQEEQAKTRRRQREQQLTAKKRLLCNQAETPGSESETNIIDSLLYDIHAGFPLKQINRGDVKVRRLQNGGVTSEEDVSLSGAQGIRSRVGSCSGGPDQNMGKEDTYSPDITPNGSLRRRRSRVPSEEDEGNLMDFLRTSGNDNIRDRKSWGSLDRSWARRARGQPRRGDLLNADFSGDRERPNSPSPLVENKPFLQEEETKPTGRAWRQKIEAWLSENEKEERAGEDLQRRARQLQANRRSFEDSGSEGKSSTMNVVFEDKPVQQEYTRVYSDWRPNVEESDVMRTMEAIEEAQPQSPQKDKSLWRKSTLNVPNSSEEADPRYLKRLNLRSSMENVLAPSTLQAIREEERKKNIISSVANSQTPDDLTIYIRQPYCAPTKTSTSAETSDHFEQLQSQQSQKKNTKPGGKNNTSTDDQISDKIEIDSDNIETPPATRRVFSPPREVKPVEKEPCRRERCSSSLQARESKVPQLKITNPPVDQGNGHFDRYSATRRTRRYKKNQDAILHKENKPEIESPTNEVPQEKPQRPRSLLLTSEDQKTEDSDPLLRIWQSRLQQRSAGKKDEINTALKEITKSGEDLQHLARTPSNNVQSQRASLRGSLVMQPAPIIPVTNTVLSPVMQETRPREPSVMVVDQARAIPNRERNRSMIDPSQVKEALRVSAEACLTTNEDNKIQINEPKQTSMFKTKFIPDISVTSNPVSKAKVEQEFNDEGFEETQSLVSETLSQGTSSGGNYETDAQDSAHNSLPPKIQRGNDETDDRNVGSKAKAVKQASKLQSYAQRTASMKPRAEKTRYPPKRTGSLERAETPKIKNSRNEVERSSSRSSLRSSRSSLNSSTSVNTVRNMAPSHHQLGGYTSAIRALTTDLRKSPSMSPVSPVHNNGVRKYTNQRTGTSRIPASRSSSSGSSIGPAVRSVPKPALVSASDSSKGSNFRNRPVVTSRSSSSSSSIEPHSQQQSRLTPERLAGTGRSRLLQPRASNIVQSHSFMRPTAASVNKGSISNLPKSIRSMAK